MIARSTRSMMAAMLDVEVQALLHQREEEEPNTSV